jgi:hypothetical protein
LAAGGAEALLALAEATDDRCDGLDADAADEVVELPAAGIASGGCWAPEAEANKSMQKITPVRDQ